MTAHKVLVNGNIVASFVDTDEAEAHVLAERFAWKLVGDGTPYEIIAIQAVDIRADERGEISYQRQGVVTHVFVEGVAVGTITRTEESNSSPRGGANRYYYTPRMSVGAYAGKTLGAAYSRKEAAEHIRRLVTAVGVPTDAQRAEAIEAEKVAHPAVKVTLSAIEIERAEGAAKQVRELEARGLTDAANRFSLAPDQATTIVNEGLDDFGVARYAVNRAVEIMTPDGRGVTLDARGGPGHYQLKVLVIGVGVQAYRLDDLRPLA